MAKQYNYTKKTGHPPKYNSPDDMQAAVDKYFEDCKAKLVTDKDGNPVLNKYGQPVVITEPITITGLALALGFNSRQSLLNYEAKPEFMDIVMRAKSRAEQYMEGRLFDRDGAMGAKFALASNFKGWSDKQTVEHTGDAVQIINNIPQPGKADKTG